MDPASSAPPTISLNLNNTIGALEVGVLLGLFLGGAALVQVLLYFQLFYKDPLVLRCLVSVCWILDFAHTIAICHTLYTITVTQYGQPQKLIIPPISLATSILLSGFIGPLEQGWFTFRLYRLTKSPFLALFCTVLTLLRFVGIIGLSTVALSAIPIPEYNARAGWLIDAVVIVSAVLDTTLVIGLCYFLSSWRVDSTRSRVTKRILHQIRIWAIQSGAMTIVGAVGLLIAYLTMKNNFIYIGFFVIIPKLFTNSLLLSLNVRERYSEIMRSSRALTVLSGSSGPQPTLPRQIEMQRITGRSMGSHGSLDLGNPLAIKDGTGGLFFSPNTRHDVDEMEKGQGRFSAAVEHA